MNEGTSQFHIFLFALALCKQGKNLSPSCYLETSKSVYIEFVIKLGIELYCLVDKGFWSLFLISIHFSLRNGLRYVSVVQLNTFCLFFYTMILLVFDVYWTITNKRGANLQAWKLSFVSKAFNVYLFYFWIFYLFCLFIFFHPVRLKLSNFQG